MEGQTTDGGQANNGEVKRMDGWILMMVFQFWKKKIQGVHLFSPSECGFCFSCPFSFRSAGLCLITSLRKTHCSGVPSGTTPTQRMYKQSELPECHMNEEEEGGDKPKQQLQHLIVKVYSIIY
nr:uncharacterized protein LOC123754057 [Procambarus clarkii]